VSVGPNWRSGDGCGLTAVKAWIAATIVCAPIVGLLALSARDSERVDLDRSDSTEIPIFGPGCGASSEDCETYP